MRNTLVYNWVKNVYSLCVEGRVNRAQIYTLPYTHFSALPTTRVKPSFFTKYSSGFTPHLYTLFLPKLPLIHSHLYTVSTAPIITRTKKK